MKNLGYGSASPGARIGEVKRDEDGMDVTDLDFDDDALAAEAASEARGR